MWNNHNGFKHLATTGYFVTAANYYLHCALCPFSFYSVHEGYAFFIKKCTSTKLHWALCPLLFLALVFTSLFPYLIYFSLCLSRFESLSLSFWSLYLTGHHICVSPLSFWLFDIFISTYLCPHISLSISTMFLLYVTQFKFVN